MCYVTNGVIELTVIHDVIDSDILNGDVTDSDVIEGASYVINGDVIGC